MPRARAERRPAPTINVNLGGEPAAALPPPAANQPEEEKATPWQRLQAIPTEEWGTRVDLYLYRTEPKVRMAAGERGYLDQLAQPITPAWIKSHYGGGKFKIIVNRDNKIFFSFEEDIVGDPIFDTKREIAPNAGGAAGGGVSPNDARVLSMLEAQLENMREELSTLRANGGNSPALDQAIHILSTAYEKGISAVQGQNGGGADLEATLGTLQKFGVLGASGGGMSGVLEKLLIAILPDLIKKFLTPTNPLEELGKSLALFKQLQDFAGGGNGDAPPKDWKAAGIQKAIEILAPVVERIAQQPPRAGVAPPQPTPIPRPGIAPPAPPPPRPLPASFPTGTAPLPGAPLPPAQPPPVSGPFATERLDGSLPSGKEEAATPGDAHTEMGAPGVDIFSEEHPAFREYLSKRIVAMVRKGHDGEDIVDFLTFNRAKKTLLALVTNERSVVTAYLLADPILKFAAEDPGWDECLKQAQEYARGQNEEDEIELAGGHVRTEPLPA